MQKIAVTGSTGLLGNKLVSLGCVPLECDITNPNSIKRAVDEVAPDVIIHCAAATNIDWCEEHPLEAFNVNVRGVSNLLDCFPTGLLVYTSTVHVFDGHSFHAYGEKHIPNPINVYGMTKYIGEILSRFRTSKTLVVRISKLFDYSTMVETLDTLKTTKMEFSGILRRSYTYLDDFAKALLYVIEHVDSLRGDILHLGSESVSCEAHFWAQACSVFGIPESQVLWRNHELKDIVPRPLQGGFLAFTRKSYNIPLLDTLSGLQLLREAQNDEKEN